MVKDDGERRKPVAIVGRDDTYYPPQVIGCYVLCFDDRLVKIGISRNLLKRIAEQVKRGQGFERELTNAAWIPTDTFDIAHNVESRAFSIVRREYGSKPHCGNEWFNSIDLVYGYTRFSESVRGCVYARETIGAGCLDK